MSKEERIEREVASRVELKFLLHDGYLVLRNEREKALWCALIAAETKLEPQTVAEPIDWEAEAQEISVIFVVAMNSKKSPYPEAVDWLKSFVQRIHSSVPDTNLAEYFAKVLHLLRRYTANDAFHRPNPDDRSGCDELTSEAEELIEAIEAESALTSYRERK